MFINCILLLIIEKTWALHYNENTVYDFQHRSIFLLVLGFIFAGILFGTICKLLIRKCALPISYLLPILATGMLLGVIAIHVPQSQPYFSITKIGGHRLLGTLLPVLVFKTAFCIDLHIFMRSKSQIIIIGVPVVMLTCCMISFAVGLIIGSTWSIPHKLILGTVCAPIYLISTIGLFSEAQNTQVKHTRVLLEGESILTIVLVDIVIILHNLGDDLKWYHFLLHFVSPIVGLIFGYVGQVIFRNCHDFQTILCVTVVLPYLTDFLCVDVIGATGNLAVVFVGVMLNAKRPSISKEMDKYLIKFWESMTHIAHTIVLLIAGLIFVRDIVRDMEGTDYAFILVTYFVSIISRFICFLVFSPILSRVSYGLTFAQMIILVWSGMKGSVNLGYGLSFYQGHRTLHVARTIYMHVVGIVVINLLLQLPVLPVLWRFTGWAELSMARKTNMNNCLKHIQIARERAVAILKMDRFLADANWPMVQTATTLEHPYKIKMDESNEQDNFFTGYRYGYCFDCKKEVPNVLTSKEIREMMREVRLRILKAQKISYFKQFESGMLPLTGLRILTQAVEIAMDTKQATLELDGLFKMFQNRSCVARLRGWLISFLLNKFSPAPVPIPKKYFRKLCYHLMMHIGFKIFIGIVVVLSLIPVILMLVYWPSLESKLGTTIITFSIIFFLIFLFEFIVKICGYSYIHLCQHGFKSYFRSVCNILDFLILIFHAVDIILVFSNIFSKSTDYGKLVLTIVRLARLLRLFRVCRLWELSTPSLIVFLNKRTDKEIVLAYEIGKAVVRAEEEILEMLPYMIDYAKIKDEMKIKMEDDRMAVTKQLAMVHKDRPWISITIKTKQAITTILNHVRDAVIQLKVTGWTEEADYNRLMESLDECYKFVRCTKYIPQSPPRVLFREVSWLADDDNVIDYLYEHVQNKKYDPGDLVCKEGELSEGIFIVVTGLFSIKYVPRSNILTDMHLYGNRPIVDYISDHKFDTVHEDYIVPGNTFGELSTLTDRAYNSSIQADTHSQVFILNRAIVKTAMYLNPDPLNGFESRLWKSISVRLATSILKEVPAYQGSSQNKIRFALVRAFMPNLSIYKSLIINEMMKDIILIEGVVIDGSTRDAYVAPKYIPRTVCKLFLPGHEQFNVVSKTRPKLMIIPIKDVKELEVMAEADAAVELLSTNSSDTKCLQHAILAKKASIYKRKAKLYGALPTPMRKIPTSPLRNSVDARASRSLLSIRSSQFDLESLQYFDKNLQSTDEHKEKENRNSLFKNDN